MYLLIPLIILLASPVYAQVGYDLNEDQFYDPTSTYEPVQRSMQESSNRYFDELDRQRREQDERDRQFELDRQLRELRDRMDQLENQ